MFTFGIVPGSPALSPAPRPRRERVPARPRQGAAGASRGARPNGALGRERPAPATGSPAARSRDPSARGREESARRRAEYEAELPRERRTSPCSGRAVAGRRGRRRAVPGRLRADDSPTAKGAAASPSRSAAEVPASQKPLGGTTSHAAAQTTPSAAGISIRHRPSASRATGNCATTITSVLIAKIGPSGAHSRPPRSSRTPAGSPAARSRPKMKRAFTAISPTNTRCRRTTR